MKIEFLYFEGCPSHEPALSLLKQVLKEKKIKERINVIEIKSEDDARKYNFFGSPSIHINGRDIEEERKNDKYLYGCRIYRTDKGTSGVPSKNMIEDAVELYKNS